MPNCIFCQIVNQEIPAAKIYEDDSVMAFLDINPVTKGHVLVIPKKHFSDLSNADDDTVGKVMAAVKKVAPAILTATNGQGFNIGMNNGRAAGQVIFHWHVHLIPRSTNDGLRLWPHGEYQKGEMETLADKIKQALA